MSSPWGIIAAPVEAPSFADIMSVDYSNNLLRKNQQKSDTVDLKKYIWDKERGDIASTVFYSESAKQTMETMAMLDDNNWESFTELEAKEAVEEEEPLPPEVMQLLEQGDNKASVKLSNQVFNQLKTYSQDGYTRNTKKSKKQDQKKFVATLEMGMDGRTRLLLHELISNGILKKINGIISAGREAVILHATIVPNNSFSCVYHSSECAIKVYKTTSEQNNREFINMKAQKEMNNLIRMRKAGIRCPVAIVLKQNILVMSFIGYNQKSAPKLKFAHSRYFSLQQAYREIGDEMKLLYTKARLVHADLSEYNILWYNCGPCYFIDVSQAIEATHPSALEFLRRDCANIVNYFSKCGLKNISTDKLFNSITN